VPAPGVGVAPGRPPGNAPGNPRLAATPPIWSLGPARPGTAGADWKPIAAPPRGGRKLAGTPPAFAMGGAPLVGDIGFCWFTVGPGL